jgi:hypothetical protein
MQGAPVNNELLSLKKLKKIKTAKKNYVDNSIGKKKLKPPSYQQTYLPCMYIIMFSAVASCHVFAFAALTCPLFF